MYIIRLKTAGDRLVTSIDVRVKDKKGIETFILRVSSI